MDADNISYGTRRLLAINIINICINILGAAITFVWFTRLQPGLIGGGNLLALRDRAIFVIVVIAMAAAIGLPMGFRFFLPLVRKFKRLGGERSRVSDLRDKLSELAGELLNAPIKFSVINLVVWLVSGLVFIVAPHVFPDYCPWDQASATKISAWTFFLCAPVVVTLGYFISESWIRTTLEVAFPEEALVARPRSTRINTLPRLLVVSIMIGVMPPIVISHIILHQITEIQNGNQSIENFLSQMPLAIGFLVSLSVALAIVLSLFLARSVSDPLQKTSSSMKKIGQGDLNVRVKVVSNDEIGVVGEGFNNMVEGLRERDYIRETFGRYLSDEVVTEILQSPEGVKLGGELRNITILVSDLRGFTTLAESLEPRKVIEILNRYFERMTDVIFHHGGTIDEFTGDGILVFFGAPKTITDHALVSVICALEMQEALKKLNMENSLVNLPELRMGIGINSGEVVVGNLGSEKRKKYGAVGSPINMAFRVESFAGADEILLAPSVYDQRLDCLELGQIIEAKLKGFDKPVCLRKVKGVKKDCNTSS